MSEEFPHVRNPAGANSDISKNRDCESRSKIAFQRVFGALGFAVEKGAFSENIPTFVGSKMFSATCHELQLLDRPRNSIDVLFPPTFTFAIASYN